MKKAELARVARSHAGVDRNKDRCREADLPHWSPAHTRAWIETGWRKSDTRTRHCRPLTRGRGSKQSLPVAYCREPTVARSHAGVDRNLAARKRYSRAPGRPLTRGRGSKRGHANSARATRGSPAHTRAWIETSPMNFNFGKDGCRPLTRGRGSKHVDDSAHDASSNGRPLTRGRGSKRHGRSHFVAPFVSPAHTRAWIET